MTTLHGHGRILLGAGLALALCVGGAHATDPCVGDAMLQKNECKATCKDDFRLAKDNCFNRDHQCMEVCRAHREECRLATGIDVALAACRQTLHDAKATCRATHPADSPELDQCIDQAQVVGFQCRRAERLAVRPELKLCRADFRACAKACPPPDVPSEIVDRRQCKLDAKIAKRACKDACKADFRIQKDLCLNRDHACVEDCRATRDACRQPFEDQRDADLAECSATRDIEVQNCKNLFPPESLEREQCIDNALVTAFVCRDQARESAKPGIRGCRDDFRTCAEGCPPAS
jgi:hypothetical protein